MRPLLFDEGLPYKVAEALSCLAISAAAVGGKGAPPRESGDDSNIEWCDKHDAVLITNDRGKKDKVIIDLLAQRRVHAIFVGRELRDGPDRHLARAVLCAENQIETIIGRGLLKHHLTAKGNLEKR